MFKVVAVPSLDNIFSLKISLPSGVYRALHAAQFGSNELAPNGNASYIPGLVHTIKVVTDSSLFFKSQRDPEFFNLQVIPSYNADSKNWSITFILGDKKSSPQTLVVETGKTFRESLAVKIKAYLNQNSLRRINEKEVELHALKTVFGEMGWESAESKLNFPENDLDVNLKDQYFSLVKTGINDVNDPGEFGVTIGTGNSNGTPVFYSIGDSDSVATIQSTSKMFSLAALLNDFPGLDPASLKVPLRAQTSKDGFGNRSNAPRVYDENGKGSTHVLNASANHGALWTAIAFKVQGSDAFSGTEKLFKSLGIPVEVNPVIFKSEMDSTLTDRLDHIEKWKSYREQKFVVLLDHFGKDLFEEAKTELKGVHSRYVDALYSFQKAIIESKQNGLELNFSDGVKPNFNNAVQAWKTAKATLISKNPTQKKAYKEACQKLKLSHGDNWTRAQYLMSKGVGHSAGSLDVDLMDFESRLKLEMDSYDAMEAYTKHCSIELNTQDYAKATHALLVASEGKTSVMYKANAAQVSEQMRMSGGYNDTEFVSQIKELGISLKTGVGGMVIGYMTQRDMLLKSGVDVADLSRYQDTYKDLFGTTGLSVTALSRGLNSFGNPDKALRFVVEFFRDSINQLKSKIESQKVSASETASLVSVTSSTQSTKSSGVIEANQICVAGSVSSLRAKFLEAAAAA